nr:Coenzyme F420 hydrogenase/dehydrogenase, beta subunit C-terminal domain [uncultured Methanoregula sp.]
MTGEYLCLSCGACSVICRQNSISYRETTGGFLFPEIDPLSCINCGLCYEICPGIHFNESLINQMPVDPFIGNIISCSVGKAKDKIIFQNSQSGGITTALVVYLLEKAKIHGAIVATMQDSHHGKAIIATSLNELIPTQKSKYIPITMLSILTDVNKIKGPVAFVGLPCQIHGLNNLLDRFPNLESKIFIKIGLICDRVQTNAVIDFFSHKATKYPIKNLTFRDKNKPSYPGNLVITNEEGVEIILDSSVRMEMKDFFTPPRCRLCFDKLNVFADVVLGDPHGIKGIDNINGETLILTRTKKGDDMINFAKNDGWINIRSIDTQSAIDGQKISDKKIMWSAYIQSWRQLGRRIPDYPKRILSFAENKRDVIKKHKMDLLQGINLDKFSTRPAIIRAAERWLLKRKIMRMLNMPFTILRNILLNIIVKKGKI